jgi:hypothetical protein
MGLTRVVLKIKMREKEVDKIAKVIAPKFAAC